MEVVPNDTDFACFIDGDAMFANEFFGAMLYEVIEKHPDKNFFLLMLAGAVMMVQEFG